MRNWSSVAVPRIPGEGRPLRLYDTAAGEILPITPGQVARMYVCGITPYDATHIGHAATYLAFDLVHRVWLDNGHQVDYVQNVTDVDEPLIERAARDGNDWVVLGMCETALFREDMEALRVLPPKEFVGAVESISEIADAVHALMQQGAAYRLDDPEFPDIYFDHTASAKFGYESRYDEATMVRLFSERGGDPDRRGKRHPLDALLWRTVREGEPSWLSELGQGRPGWHIECSVIAVNRLGMGFDIQGGGSDLIFPHHEYSAAHAEALAGAHPFAQHYVHAGMVKLNGEKMSKSRGNLVFVSRLRSDGVESAAVRLALLAGHYRSDRSWTPELLSQAQARLHRWREALTSTVGPAVEPTIEKIRVHLADDLDTPGALAAVDRWVERASELVSSHRTNEMIEAEPHYLRKAVDALLGVEL